MHQVQLDDKLYKEAQRKAAKAGFSSVDEYIAEVVNLDLQEETEHLDHIFTPEVIAELDGISARIKAGGKTYTLEQVKEHFDQKRQEWLRHHAR